jgi:hypothetical protein
MGLDGSLVYSPQTCFCTIIEKSVSMDSIPRNGGRAHTVEQNIGRAERACRHRDRDSEIVYPAIGLVLPKEKYADKRVQ